MLYFSLLLLLPGLLLGMYAQFRVMNTYGKFSKVSCVRKITGNELARKMLNDNGLHDVSISQIGGKLTDHFDPRVKEVRLSYDVYFGDSIASLGIAAHEVGHAIQHHNSYFPLYIRNLIIPVTGFSNYVYMPLLLIGLLLSNSMFINIGIMLFTCIVFFQLITLPVEFNASKRAINTLSHENLLDSGELIGAKKVLTAAGLTYVAAVVTSILQLIRLLMIFGSNNE